MPLRAAGLTQDRARPSLGDAQAIDHMIDRTPPPRRAHKFGLAASRRIAIMSVQTNGDSSAQRLHAGRDCSVDH